MTLEERQVEAIITDMQDRRGLGDMWAARKAGVELFPSSEETH